MNKSDAAFEELDENGVAYAYHAYERIKALEAEGFTVYVALFTSDDSAAGGSDV